MNLHIFKTALQLADEGQLLDPYTALTRLANELIQHGFTKQELLQAEAEFWSENAKGDLNDVTERS